MLEEIWINIEGFESYQVSNLGRVKSFKSKTEKILKLQKQKDGYIKIGLGNKTVLVHRLVAKAFIPNVKNKPQVNHKNKIVSDNRISNLEWVTLSENVDHKLGRVNWDIFSENIKAKISEMIKF